MTQEIDNNEVVDTTNNTDYPVGDHIEETPVLEASVLGEDVKTLESEDEPDLTDGTEGGDIAQEEDLLANITVENLSDVSTELLLHILEGKTQFPENEIKHVVTAYRQRVELPLAWRSTHVVEFIRTGNEPAKTSKGDWLVDETRSSRVASEWTTTELESWALGEIHAGGRTHDNGLALELKARLSLRCEDRPKSVRAAYKALSNGNITVTGTEASKPVYVSPARNQTEQLQHSKAIAARIETVEGLTPMNVAFIDDALNRYIDAVKPGKVISEANGLKAQNELDTLFQYVVGLEPQGMVAGLERIKACFRKQMVKGGVFESSNVFRFTHLLRTENNRRARHVALLELMRIYFSEATEGRKQCDARALLTHQAPEKAEMLVEYFTKRA